MESKFDVNKLIEIANKYYPKFYKEFILIFNDNKEAMETSIKLAIDIEDDKYKDEFITYKYDFYSIIKDTGIFYKIYKNEKNFYDDFVHEKLHEKM